MTYFQCLLQLLLSPQAGWEDVQASKPRPEALLPSRLLPLMAACAAMQALQLIYHPALPIADVVINALVAFVAMFATLVIARTAFERVLPEVNPLMRNAVVVYAMGLMALAFALPAALPAPMGLNYLLPVGVGIVVTKAVDCLAIDRNNLSRFLVLIFASISLPPMLIQAFFEWALFA